MANMCNLHSTHMVHIWRKYSRFRFSPANWQIENRMSISGFFISFPSKNEKKNHTSLFALRFINEDKDWKRNPFSCLYICRRRTKTAVLPSSFFFRKWTNRKSDFVAHFLLLLFFFFFFFFFLLLFRLKVGFWFIIRFCLYQCVWKKRISTMYTHSRSLRVVQLPAGSWHGLSRW